MDTAFSTTSSIPLLGDTLPIECAGVTRGEVSPKGVCPHALNVAARLDLYGRALVLPEPFLGLQHV